MSTKKQVLEKELILRELESRTEPQRESLIEYTKYMFKNGKNMEFRDNWHYHLLEKKLKDVLDGKITRLMINIPPGSGKSEIISKCFPTWALGVRPQTQIMSVSYGADLAEKHSMEAREYYRSDIYRQMFPRRSPILDSQDTKSFWANKDGGYYIASGLDGAITGKRANIFLIDDPLRPGDADSDVERNKVNTWYSTTVTSRLHSPKDSAIIIIMQRTHENDLCGYLMDREEKGIGEEWDKVVLPSEKEYATEYQELYELDSLQPHPYDMEALGLLKKAHGPEHYATQYLQDPSSKTSREFHEEYFRHFKNAPEKGRIFMAVDPAFSQKKSADNTAIAVVRFVKDEVYIEEVLAGKWNPSQMEDNIVMMVRKWLPEKLGIEVVQAQATISFALKNRFRRDGINCVIEEIRPKGKKEERIRGLLPLYTRYQIFHKENMLGLEDFEHELLSFPRGRHDDMIDATEMAIHMGLLQPKINLSTGYVDIKYNDMGQPVFIEDSFIF